MKGCGSLGPGDELNVGGLGRCSRMCEAETKRFEQTTANGRTLTFDLDIANGGANR